MSETLTLREIEEQFKELQYYLSGGISSRIKLSILHNFLSVINQQTSPQRFYSYFQEIQEQIPELLLPHNLQFRSAEFLDQIKLYREMIEKTGIKIETDLITGKANTGPDDSTGFADNTVWIPLVEQEQTKGFGLIRVATIQPLTVQVEQRRSDADIDLIFFNNYPVNMGDPFYNQALDAVGAAKKQLKMRRNGGMPRFRVMFGFTDREYFYTGESFGLGMSLAVLAQMEKVTIQRTQHKINQNAVITGGIDVNGQVRGVSEESLPAKLEAFYYSPFRTFVHPEVNQSVAEETLAELALFSHSEPREESQSSPPNPNDPETQKLKIFPTSDLNTVLKNETITRKQTITLREWSRAHIRRNHVLAYVVVFLLLAGVGWGSWWFTRDLNPVSAQVFDNVLRVFNVNNDFLWEYSFGFHLTADHYSEATNVLKNLRKMQIDDFDGDGKNELIFGVAEIGGNENGTVFYFETDGSLVWNYQSNSKVPFNGVDIGGNYSVRFILPVYNSFFKETKFAVLLRHCLYYPSRLLLINIRGDVINQFWNSGAISDAFILEKNSGREQELIFSGTNNEYGQGVVGILHMDKLWGRSPQIKDQYIPDGVELASSVKYLKFPHFNKYLNPDEIARDEIRSIWLESDTLINVQMLQSGVRYSFSTDYKLLNYIITDSYLVNYFRKHKVHLYQSHSFSEVDSVIRAIDEWKDSSWSKFVSSPK